MREFLRWVVFLFAGINWLPPLRPDTSQQRVIRLRPAKANRTEPGRTPGLAQQHRGDLDEQALKNAPRIK